MKTKLLAHIDRKVRLFNVNDEQSEGSFRFHVHGMLRHCPEEQDEFSVVIGEDRDGHGTNYISFGAKDIVEVSKAPSGIIEVILK